MLRRLDHAAIFLLIAGTYSPFLDDATGDPMVDIGYAGVWIVAGAGMLTQLHQKAIWHGFVMTAAGIHFLAVLTFVRSWLILK